MRHFRTHGPVMVVLGSGWLIRTNSQQVERLSEVSHFPAIAEQASVSISAPGSGAMKSSFGKGICSVHAHCIFPGSMKIRCCCNLHTYVRHNGEHSEFLSMTKF